MVDDTPAKSDSSGDEWTLVEIEAVVSDYRDMLRIELAGLPYNKSEHRRNLMLTMHRSEGSVEFKHQNISAVLEEIGLPWIKGYKPRHNYQASLVSFVERLIADKVETLAPLVQPIPKADPTTVFVPPPLKSDIQTRPPAATIRLARKIDQAARDNRNRKLGAEGEEFVFEAEKRKLDAFPVLAAQVRWVSRDEGDGLGYDVRSFDTAGTELFIEVKTTRGGIKTPFYISASELSAASNLGPNYRLYRVFEFGPAPYMYELRTPLPDHVNLEASIYRAGFG